MALAAASALAVSLAGCGFVGDLVEGQRLTAERLGVDAALRALTSELAGIDGVESAVYGFDAVDVSSNPGLEVVLASTDFALWHDVVTRVEDAADGALADYAVTVNLSSEVIDMQFDTRWGAPWLTEPVLQVATRAASVFPGSTPGASGISNTDASVYLTVPGSAEELISRLRDDPEVVELLEFSREAHTPLFFTVEMIGISGSPDDALLQWMRDRLASGVPLAGGEAQQEWMMISIAQYDGVASVSGSWGSASDLGEGAAWDAFMAALRAGPPTTASGDCVESYLSVGWPGIGNSAGVYSGCDAGEAPSEPEPESEPQRVTALREALAAEGIVAEELGWVVG